MAGREEKNYHTMASMESELELKGRILTRKAAGEGMVLLKNKDRIHAFLKSGRMGNYGNVTSYSAYCTADKTE